LMGYFFDFSKMVLKSMRMERVKSVKYARCGMTSSKGTDKGKLSSVGSRTVKTGIDNSKFDECFWNRTHASFVLNMNMRDARKKVNSTRILVKLVISIPMPYHSKVAGHNSCMPLPPPIRKSPGIECWIMATKYGVALFPKRKKAGKERRERKIREWVNPRCSNPGINRSMSDITEATNNRGMFTLTFRSLDVALPVMYPKAR